ncbi:MAG: MarR family transcriptional regulator [Candidatus Kapaibacterium sp.]|nr:MAG: MarR family transcriptional regulator [Candidatus Kapabacteria bacterium]
MLQPSSSAPYQTLPSVQTSTVFNPHYNSFNTASKIVVALERISEAFRVMLWQESKANGLSPLQIQILIFLAFHTQEKRTVSYLAQEFNMTKPTISDAVRVLLEKKLTEKEQNLEDTRSYAINLTAEGRAIAERASAFANKFDAPLLQMPPIEQEYLLGQLMNIVNSFQKAGILTNQRSCHSCVFISKHAYSEAHHCSFLRQTLSVADIRVDCPHYRPVS